MAKIGLRAYGSLISSLEVFWTLGHAPYQIPIWSWESAV